MTDLFLLIPLGLLASFLAFVVLAPEEMRPEMPGEVECEGWDGKGIGEEEREIS